MIETLIVIVIGLLVIAGATVLGPRLGIAAPLVLVAIGVAASFLPLFGSIVIDPEWILLGILPPLLYSAAVSMPAMNFRREFAAISGLSVFLVVATALVLGVFFMFAIPELGFAWGVALGAIISPTDAVAISIIKANPVSKRVISMLDGESLLNDATALVLLRTAIVATAAAFSFWGAVGAFAYSVVVAVVVGLAIGWLNLAVRKKLTDSTVNTVISFTVPFLAAVPPELLGASGLVAAVVAGLVTGIRAPKVLSPQNRLSDSQNWRMVELVLEGAVFLTMGVQLKGIVQNVYADHAGVGLAVVVAAGALFITIVVRAAYVAPLLASLSRYRRRMAGMKAPMQNMQNRLGTLEGKREAFQQVGRGGRQPSERHLNVLTHRVTQTLADIEYFLNAPLGWREGGTIVWAGMRGAVTVAAAQTLPEDTPQRATLILIAFTVAAMSLLLQGGTIGPLLKRISPNVDEAAAAEEEIAERTRIIELLRASSAELPPAPPRDGQSSAESFAAAKKHQLMVLGIQRAALLDARDHGTFDADILESELANLDAAQIAIEMRG